MNDMDPGYVVADLNARVRYLENKYNLLTERLLVVNQNMMEQYRKVMAQLRELQQEKRKVALTVMNTQEIIKDVVKELGAFAKKDQIKVLEKYVDLINILRFVTEDDLNRKLETFKSEIIDLKEEKSDEDA